MGAELATSRIVISSQRAPLSCGPLGYGENWKGAYSATVSACWVVFNQEHWKRWTEAQKRGQKSLLMLSFRWGSLTSQAAGSSPNLWCFLDHCYRGRCWFRWGMLLSPLWSPLLRECRQRTGAGIHNRHPAQARIIFKLVLLQCGSWMGIFKRDCTFPQLQMWMKNPLSLFISCLWFLHCPLSLPKGAQCTLLGFSVFESTFFFIQGRGGNNILPND